MPLFFLQARQLTSDMPLVAGLALALGGLGRFAWPGDGRRRWRDLAVGLRRAGDRDAVGWRAAGRRPAGAGAAGHRRRGLDADARPRPVPEAPRLAEPGVGPDVPAERSFGRSLIGSTTGIVVLVIGAVGLVILILTLTTANVAGQYSLLLGGTPRGGTPPTKFEYLIRQVGFGVFPWSALMVFALGRALVRLGDERWRAGGAPGLRAAVPAGVRRVRLRAGRRCSCS